MAKSERKPKARDQTRDVRSEGIEAVILPLRGQKVLLDRDLARLYGVATGNLNKAVQRNLIRFPGDFMFQLTTEEADSLRFHFGSLNRGLSVSHAVHKTFLAIDERVIRLTITASGASCQCTGCCPVSTSALDK